MRHLCFILAGTFLLVSASAFSAVVQIEGKDITAGTLYSLGKGQRTSASLQGFALNKDAGNIFKFMPVTMSVGSAGSIRQGDKIVASGSGTQVLASVPRGDAAVRLSASNCWEDTMMGEAFVDLATANRPSGANACTAGNMTFCGLHYAWVSHSAACPTSSGSYSSGGFDEAYPTTSIGSGVKTCFYVDYTQRNGDDTETEFETQQEATDTYHAYCDCDGSGNCSTGIE